MRKKRKHCKRSSIQTSNISQARNDGNVDLDFLKIQYQALSDRRINHSSMLWSMPSLLFVAQALLWNIALNNEISIAIRCVISTVSILVGVITLHSFERHRLMEVSDAEQLYSIELLLHELNSAPNKRPVLTIHHTLENRKRFENGIEKPLEDFLPKPSLLGRQPAFKLWRFMFKCIIVITVVIAIYNFFLLRGCFKAYFESYLHSIIVSASTMM